MKRLGWAVLAATALGSGAYVFVYLYRWEWHRALFAAVAFLAAEVAICTALVMRRLARGRPSDTPRRASEPDPQVIARLRASTVRHDPFAWMRPRADRTNVFVTMLLGGGVLISAAAWAVDRLAARTAGVALERDLARRLRVLELPEAGFVADDAELLAQDVPYADDPELRLLLGPGHGRR
jgi:hypothetical protein